MSDEAEILAIHLQRNEYFPLNVMYDHLHLMVQCRDENKEDLEWVRHYDEEIAATKKVLKILTT